MVSKSSASTSFAALVVDSQAARRDDLVDVLKNCGYNAAFAETLESAKKTVASQAWNVILCQDVLKDGKGLDLLNAIRRQKMESHFILMADQESSPAVKEARTRDDADVLINQENYAELFPKLAAMQSEAQGGDSQMAVHPIKLTELTQGPVRGDRASVDMVMDIPISVSVILGSTTMLVQDLLQLGPGSVVELDKRAGEPIDIYVNDKLLAMGEVVVVNETFGVRISEIIDPKQRVQALA